MLNENVDRSGLFIALEGIEGSGKSTQAALLAKALREKGHDVIEVKEPGGTEVGMAIREIFLSKNESLHPATEVGLLISAKAQLIHTVIIPALKAGKVVVCDRYTDSLYAYQWYAKGIEKKMIDRLLEASDCLLWPDLSIMVDITPEISVTRVAARKSAGGEVNVFDTKPTEFVRKTREGIQRSYAENDRGPSKAYSVIDGSGAIDQVHKNILDTVDVYTLRLIKDYVRESRTDARQ